MKTRISIVVTVLVTLILLTLLIGIASAANNSNLHLSTTAVTEIKSDDFNQQTLAPFWTHVPGVTGDPAPVMNGSEVEIKVDSGINHDIWESGNFSSRIMQPAPDSNFEVEVKFTSGVSDTYQMQGILIEQDSDDFLRVEFFGQDGETNAFAVNFASGTPEVKARVTFATGDTAPLFLRVKREGDVWSHFYSTDGNNWTNFATFTRSMTVASVGIYAANAGPSPPEHITKADYFHNTANPGPFTLTVIEVGNGTVDKDPGGPTYSASEFVTLEASPSTGWVFDSWSGDVSGTTNPIQIVMDDDKTVTATFTSLPYTLDVSVNPPGAGTVIKNPQKDSYVYGDVVTLTAEPATGWSFDEWSGDVVSTTNPIDVTIDGNKNITASFIQMYKLTMELEGDGTVLLDPAGGSYGSGTVVTLTPVPDPFWIFSGWEGSNAGELTDNQDGTWSITMDSQKTITAVFKFTVYLPIVTNS